ncbi:MAG: polysaccharide pyruvyl transferase family protein [Bacteroidetes bacterium]|nr:polysaccharide pyruvyl transferase family protein [Bacteroidota bacterium]
MKYASLIYTTSSNLGDQIQSIAIEQFLPSIDAKFDRDYLSEVSNKEKHLLIMQGWFSHLPEKCFPPSDSIIPVFFGFHITDWNESIEYFLKPLSVDYLKHHEPIGCRDKKTMEMLIEKGVDAFYSKCLTLTFPKREIEPENGKVFLVNVDGIDIPESIRKDSISLSHYVYSFWDEEVKYLMAKKIIELYRDEAKLIVTTKLHCALPCIAMGIPVVFFGNPDDYRTSIIKDLNIPIYPIPEKIVYKPISFTQRIKSKLYNKLRINQQAEIANKVTTINWNPIPVSIEQEKEKIINNIKSLIAKTIKNV